MSTKLLQPRYRLAAQNTMKYVQFSHIMAYEDLNLNTQPGTEN